MTLDLKWANPPWKIPSEEPPPSELSGGVFPRVMALRTSFAWRLRNFAMNHHGSCGFVTSFIDRGKRVPVLRHTLPKLKSFSIYADCVDDASGHIRTEVTTQHLSLDRLYALINHAFEFTPLCI